MNKLFLLFLLFLQFNCSSYNSRTIDVKTPCVSNEKGPCGPRIPVNDWWIKDNNLINS